MFRTFLLATSSATLKATISPSTSSDWRIASTSILARFYLCYCYLATVLSLSTFACLSTSSWISPYHSSSSSCSFYLTTCSAWMCNLSASTRAPSSTTIQTRSLDSANNIYALDHLPSTWSDLQKSKLSMSKLVNAIAQISCSTYPFTVEYIKNYKALLQGICNNHSYQRALEQERKSISSGQVSFLSHFPYTFTQIICERILFWESDYFNYPSSKLQTYTTSIFWSLNLSKRIVVYLICCHI